MMSYLGSVQIFAFSTTPHGFAQCNGQLVTIAANPQLFKLIGNTYGGDGKTNFALPSLKPLGASGPYYCIGVSGAAPPK